MDAVLFPRSRRCFSRRVGVCFRPFASPRVREKPRCNNGESRGSGAARSDVAAGGFGTDAHGCELCL
eukprot:symbB.v1.2.019618.t1/scaffold1614.1/size109413/5